MTTWHVDDSALREWMSHSEAPQQAASVEQHLLACTQCRDQVRDLQTREAREPIDVDRGWARLRDAIQAPRPSLLERSLRRIGLPEADARLVAAADAFRGPWLMGVLAVLAFVVLAAEFGRASGQAVFLAVAPLLPSLAVAVSYDPTIEPALEQELVTPYPRLRLILLRTIAVLALGLPVVLVISPFAPGGAPFLWLLPAAGFVTAVLALSTWTDPLYAVGALGAVWVAVVMATALNTSAEATLRAPYRIVYLGVAAVSIVILAARVRHLRELHTGRSGL